MAALELEPLSGTAIGDFCARYGGGCGAAISLTPVIPLAFLHCICISASASACNCAVLFGLTSGSGAKLSGGRISSGFRPPSAVLVLFVDAIAAAEVDVDVLAAGALVAVRITVPSRVGGGILLGLGLMRLYASGLNGIPSNLFVFALLGG